MVSPSGYPYWRPTEPWPVTHNARKCIGLILFAEFGGADAAAGRRGGHHSAAGEGLHGRRQRLEGRRDAPPVHLAREPVLGTGRAMVDLQHQRRGEFTVLQREVMQTRALGWSSLPEGSQPRARVGFMLKRKRCLRPSSRGDAL